MDISFYHLTVSPLERALPQLLEKGYESGLRCLVVADKDKLKSLDDTLWTSYQQKFLPHGLDKPEVQPIFLSDKIANDNRQLIAITNGQIVKNEDGFNKVLDLFNGNLDQELNAARQRWKTYKDAGLEPKYWFQDEKGKWIQK